MAVASMPVTGKTGAGLRFRLPCIALGILIAMPMRAGAHGGIVHSPDFGWTFDPVVLLPLGILSMMSLAGFWKLHARSRLSRRHLALRGILLAAGLITLAAALVSPLHEVGEALFTAHMIEHELVMTVAAPLIVLARPLALVLFALPRRMRQLAGRALKRKVPLALWRWSSGGTAATLIHGLVIWVWHMPMLFDRTVEQLPLHRLQHASFLFAALLFWWAVLWRPERGIAAWHLFATMLHTSLLGALMALAPGVLYPAQTRLAPHFGLTPLEDQQLAGMLMWVPAGTIYAAALFYLLLDWIRQSGKEGAHAAGPL